MNLIGRTEEQGVVGGLFPLADTHGVPFHLIIDGVYASGLRICWITWVTEALNAGWKLRTIIGKLIEGVEESINLPRSDKSVIIEKLRLLRNFE